nr:MAG TPA: hypothetical protein [Caudoviricetes sp.]
MRRALRETTRIYKRSVAKVVEKREHFFQNVREFSDFGSSVAEFRQRTTKRATF